jgi:hypothetical protein
MQGKERQMRRGWMFPVSTALLVATGLAGCASTTPVTTSAIRGSAQTAPADLQLLCASEAQTRFGAPANSVLPIASRPGGAPGSYLVDLKLPAGQATCAINDSGVIASLDKL